MRRVLILGLIVAFGVFFVGVYRIQKDDPATADFLIKCALSIGTLSAVLFALFGDFLRARLDPVRVRIEVPDERNNFLDKHKLGDTTFDTYCHHLRVRSLSPHKPIINCRVWLRKLLIQKENGEWEDKFKFAVPRLMEWAPSEYSRDKRTFSTQQVFDLGITLSNNGGFLLTVDREQQGAFRRLFPVGQNLRCVFVVTGDNYEGENDFCFEIVIPSSLEGKPVTPAKVTAV